MDVEPPGQQEAGSHVKEEPEGNVTLERAVGSGDRLTVPPSPTRKHFARV